MRFNRVILVGRLTRDPELRYTREGMPMVVFALAVSRLKSDETDFFLIRAFGRLAEIVNEYLSKGSLVLVEGFLQSRRWRDDNNTWHSTVEVMAQNVRFLERKKDKPKRNQETEVPDNDEPPF